MSTLRLILGGSLVVWLAACSNVPYAQRVSERQAAYAAAAGTPQRSFRFFNLYSWEPLGGAQLAVYTRPNEAYLLDLDGGCPNLEYANSIGLTSSINEVSVRFDRVLTGPGYFPCTITQIRPIDVTQLKAQEKAQRKIEAKPRPPEHAAQG
ncbi:DUF6491 family protein [Dyella tabacisoli]|uniref:Uncharacterized protein n=1 Tax=Dyella tabacisoli TaxID=2282381 RepID=A0A369UHV5_9GAMM|nr:DUF6491 family protein [Dyella tabacisoli]RDD80334.1 hypothetical protein DVJ77_17965 [Dyella tabacisoli]